MGKVGTGWSGGSHISESAHVLGQPLCLRHILAAPTQSLDGRLHLLGQALAHLAGLQGDSRMSGQSGLFSQDRGPQSDTGQGPTRDTEQLAQVIQ